jgi:hypothetical protein
VCDFRIADRSDHKEDADKEDDNDEDDDEEEDPQNTSGMGTDAA